MSNQSSRSKKTSCSLKSVRGSHATHVKSYDVADVLAAQELYHNGWTDGLPVVPPTADAVEACLDWAGMTPEQLIGIEPVKARYHRRKLAINAVIAGVYPCIFPPLWQS